MYVCVCVRMYILYVGVRNTCKDTMFMDSLTHKDVGNIYGRCLRQYTRNNG